jgi:thiamine transport system substrate-binding protein
MRFAMQRLRSHPLNLIRLIPAEGAMLLSNRGRALGRALAFIAIALHVPCAFAQGLANAEEKSLVVYTYDSFVSEWGAGPKIALLFEKATGIKVKFVSKGDGGQLLSALILEKDRADADLALGLDNFLAPKALASGLFRAYKPTGYEAIPASLKLDPSARLIPYDYGDFAIVWDSAKLASPPMSLEDLTKSEYAKKLILLDPRTSTPGLGFLAWTKAVYGPAWRDYWKRLRPSVLTLAPSWDQGYGLFTSGEAPLVLSYAADGAYHLEYEKTERYKPLAFKDGFVKQVETAGILARARHPRNAEAFMDFLVSAACQGELPLTQWMYPVLPSVALPDSYRAAVKAVKSLEADPSGLTDEALEAADILSSKS